MTHLKNLDQFIREHKVVSWIVWILGLQVFLQAVGRLAVAPKDAHFGWTGWLTVAFMVGAAVLVLTLERRVRRQQLPNLAIRWLVAQSPIFFSFLAVLDGGPQYLIAIAQGEAIVLMIYALRRDREAAPVD